MTPPTLLLTGATGFLGRRLAPGLAGAWRVVPASRTAAGPGAVRLDLTDLDSIPRALDAVRPVAVVHAGAAARPDDCERDPDLARRLNLDATRVVAEWCGRTGARLVHLSTDLVFDGTKGDYREDDAPNPISVYGRVKLAAEEAVLKAAPGAVVLRVASAYGRRIGEAACFVDELIAALSAGRPTGAFVDQWRSPTAGDRLPGIVGRCLADARVRGAYHWGCPERVSRFDAAKVLCRVFGWDEALVTPTRAGDKAVLAPRPRDTSLDSSRLAAALGEPPTPLAVGFAELKAAAAGSAR